MAMPNALALPSAPACALASLEEEPALALVLLHRGSAFPLPLRTWEGRRKVWDQAVLRAPGQAAGETSGKTSSGTPQAPNKQVACVRLRV